MFGQSRLKAQYSAMKSSDIPPNENSDLARYLSENPKVLESEFVDPEYHWSVLGTQYIRGNLHNADFILKKNGQLKKGADPFYFGATASGLEVLLESAGVNFYLALVSLHFLAQQGKLNELVVEDELGKVMVNKTHYDYLYWQDGAGIHPAELGKKFDRTKPAVVEDYQQGTAKFFVKLAYEVYQAERCINHSATSLVDKQEAHRMLSQRYLHIVYMEDAYQHTFSYLLDKAFEHYCLAYPENSKQRQSTEVMQHIEKLTQYIEYREEIFDVQLEKSMAQLQDDETGYIRKRTFHDWEEAYDSAYRRKYVIKDNVVERHSLHFDEKEKIWWDTIDTLFDDELHSVTMVTEAPPPTPSPERKHKSMYEGFCALFVSASASASASDSGRPNVGKLKKN